MTSAWSNPVDNLAEVIHEIKCTYGHDNKKNEKCWIKYKDHGCCLEYTNVKDGLIVYKFLFWNKNYQIKNWWKLKKVICQYKFSNDDINKIILLLWKGVSQKEFVKIFKKIWWVSSFVCSNNTLLLADVCMLLLRTSWWNHTL